MRSFHCFSDFDNFPFVTNQFSRRNLSIFDVSYSFSMVNYRINVVRRRKTGAVETGISSMYERLHVCRMNRKMFVINVEKAIESNMKSNWCQLVVSFGILISLGKIREYFSWNMN